MMDNGQKHDFMGLSQVLFDMVLDDGRSNMLALQMLSGDNWSTNELNDLQNIMSALAAIIYSHLAKSK